MNIPRSLWNATGVLLFSLACLIQAGCSAETENAPTAAAPARGEVSHYSESKMGAFSTSTAED